jgi:hypothetical protein
MHHYNPTMAACIVLLLCLGSSMALPSSRRQLAYGHYDDDDIFREDAVFLSPADRQARQSSGLDLEFPQLDESFAGPEFQRQERDGGSHGAPHGRRTGRRNGRVRQQQQQNQRQQHQQTPGSQTLRK